MTGEATARPLAQPDATAPIRALPGARLIEVAGVPLAGLPEGVLWWAERRLMVVADLHLEKGSAFARRGQMVPPYDTVATLSALARVIERLDPRAVIALGDSFHDSAGADRLNDLDRAMLHRLQLGREWVWIAGNHDPDLPQGAGGERTAEATIGPLLFRHEPQLGAAAGEIAGHLHPAARVAGRAGSVRRKCFAADGARAILPAFGAYAGGLNVLDAPFDGLFGANFIAFVLGAGSVYPVHRRRLTIG
ncbi:MAG: ligase-associated DNA damage response endonuclease PdeM [Bauldia sp.]|nr:ligase-associated DNA damage response endonuclease PdeM [Bauldia sp.]